MTDIYKSYNCFLICKSMTPKWTSHRISLLRLCLRCDIAIGNSYSQNQSTILYRQQVLENWFNGFLLILVTFVQIYYILYRGPSWSWLYGGWIYNYLCNQCISLLKLWVWISWRGVLYTTLCDEVCQCLATGLWFSRVLRFPLLKYCWK